MTNIQDTTTMTEGGTSADLSIDQLEMMAKDADGGEMPSANQAEQPKNDAPDDSGKAAKTEPTKAEESKAEAPTESKFQRAKKDAERLGGGWEKFTKEKEQFRSWAANERAEMARLKAEIAEVKEQKQATQKSGGPDADTYAKLAERYESEGDEQMARMARAKAEELRQSKVSQPNEAQGEPHLSPRFQAEWQRHVSDLVQGDPSLNEATNPVAKATMQLVDDPSWGRFFKAHPDGIKAAHQVAQLMRTAGEAKEIQKQLEAAKAEIGRLNKLTSLKGSHPAGGPNLRSAANATLADLESLAAAADRGD